MDEKSPKIIALLDKIERNTGKLISLMVKGTGTVVGAGRATKAVTTSAVIPINATALKAEKGQFSKPSKALFASQPISKPATPPTPPDPAELSRRGEGKGGQEPKNPLKSVSKATVQNRPLPARDAKGRFVKRQTEPTKLVKSASIMPRPDKTEKTGPKMAKESGPVASNSQQALNTRRRKKESDAERAGMAKLFGKVLKTSSKIALAGVKGFIWSQQMRSGGNALGFATGGAFWAGMQEVVEAVQTAKDNRILQVIGQKFSQLKTKIGGKAQAKGGEVRDNRGRFIPGANATPATVPDAKGRVSTIGSVGQKAKTATRNKRIERKGDRQHRELIRAVEGVSDGRSESALMNFLPRIAGPIGKMGKMIGKVFGLFAKGPVKALAGAAGVAGSAAAVGGKMLGKVPILGKVLPGAAKMGGKVLGESGGKFAAKEGGKLLAKTGVKAVGKSVLKKIPALGLLAGAGFAISRLAKGDMLGAIAELGSGAVSLVPGIGTAASVAIDAGLAARDISRESNKDLKNSLNKDFESATIPETASAPVQNKPPAVETVQTIDQAPAQQSISVSTITAAFEAALKRVLGQQAKDKGQKQPYRIPTDFDEPLLVLMAHDRI